MVACSLRMGWIKILQIAKDCAKRSPLLFVNGQLKNTDILVSCQQPIYADAV